MERALKADVAAAGLALIPAMTDVVEPTPMLASSTGDLIRVVGSGGRVDVDVEFVKFEVISVVDVVIVELVSF